MSAPGPEGTPAQAFSLDVNSQIAPVGQTWPQRVQLGSQYPTRGTSTGVQMPSQPASVSAGCKALFGHTFMHSPQRIQRARNGFSSNAAGGRMSRSCGSAV